MSFKECTLFLQESFKEIQFFLCLAFINIRVNIHSFPFAVHKLSIFGVNFPTFRGESKGSQVLDFHSSKRSSLICDPAGLFSFLEPFQHLGSVVGNYDVSS